MEKTAGNYIKQAKGFDTYLEGELLPKNAVYGCRGKTLFYVLNFQQFKKDKQRYSIYLKGANHSKFKKLYVRAEGVIMQSVIEFVRENNLYEVHIIRKNDPELGKNLTVSVIRTRHDYIEIILRRSGLNREHIKYSKKDKCYYLTGKYAIGQLNIEYSMLFPYDKVEHIFEIESLRKKDGNFIISGNVDDFTLYIISGNVYNKGTNGAPKKLVNASISQKAGNAKLYNDFYGSIEGFKIKYKPEQKNEYDGYDAYDDNYSGRVLPADFLGLRYPYTGLYK